MRQASLNKSVPPDLLPISFHPHISPLARFPFPQSLRTWSSWKKQFTPFNGPSQTYLNPSLPVSCRHILFDFLIDNPLTVKISLQQSLQVSGMKKWTKFVPKLSSLTPKPSQHLQCAFWSADLDYCPALGFECPIHGFGQQSFSPCLLYLSSLSCLIGHQKFYNKSIDPWELQPKWGILKLPFAELVMPEIKDGPAATKKQHWIPFRTLFTLSIGLIAFAYMDGWSFTRK